MKHFNRVLIALMVSVSVVGSSCQRVSDETPVVPKPTEINAFVLAGTDSIYSIHAQNGVKKWSAHVVTNNRHLFHPTVTGNTVIITSNQSGSITGFDVATGIRKWKADLFGDPVTNTYVLKNKTYTGYWAARSAHGIVTVEVGSGTSSFEKGTDGYQPTDLLPTDSTLFVGCSGATLMAINLNTNGKRWKSTGMGDFNTRLAVSNGLIFWGSNSSTTQPNGTLIAMDSKNGSVMWDFKADGSFSSPTIHQGVIYLWNSNQTLYALETATGKLRWEVKTGGSRGYNAPFFYENNLYLTGEDGKLYIVKADTGINQSSIGSANGYKFITNPTVANGMAFIGDEQGYLHAIDVSTSKEMWVFRTGKTSFSLGYFPVVITSSGRVIGFEQRGGEETN